MTQTLLSPEARHAAIMRLADLPAQLTALVSDLTPEQLTTAYMPGEWTIAQNVHHVADAHLNAFARMKRIVTEEHPTIQPYEQDDWAVTPDAMIADIASSLSLIQGVHGRWVALLAGLTDAQWARTAYHPEVGETGLHTMLAYYAEHGYVHIAQIKATLAAAE